MTQIFISYKHDDGDFAELLKGKIERAGFNAWLDENIQAGEEWREMIDLAIRDSAAVVVIMTPDARGSEYVTYEWAYALGLGVPVIPVLLKDTNPLHPRLEVLQYLDFTRRRNRPWDDLIDRLRAVVEGRGSRGSRRTKRPAGAVQEQIDRLTDPSYLVRRDAAVALGQRRDPAAVPALARLLTTDHSVRVRAACAEALGWIGDPAAVPDLITALQDAHPDVRAAAADALHRLDTPDARAALRP